ncbi:hypothetical protein CALVIDRAFT_589478 [Calocera viscosa TUFC12733]|uniref:Uncharacterized protein n=1 Tax=Calocera viscosa (strain TUFC12733) TaxID=1330018 RepID=A0A167GUQ3_CALVF|nr:hypothetical protein CALVIDRAFT_589478 [Calocera viscosa TUFC12733]
MAERKKVGVLPEILIIHDARRRTARSWKSPSFRIAELFISFLSLHGSSIPIRYVRSSYQNDPLRTVIEVILLLFALRTILQSYTRAEHATKNYVQHSKSKIDTSTTGFPSYWSHLSQRKTGRTSGRYRS